MKRNHTQRVVQNVSSLDLLSLHRELTRSGTLNYHTKTPTTDKRQNNDLIIIGVISVGKSKESEPLKQVETAQPRGLQRISMTLKQDQSWYLT